MERRRARVCVAPAYPGGPEGYRLIPERCVMQRANNAQQQRSTNSAEVSAIRTFLVGQEVPINRANLSLAQYELLADMYANIIANAPKVVSAMLNPQLKREFQDPHDRYTHIVSRMRIASIGNRIKAFKVLVFRMLLSHYEKKVDFD